MDAIAEFIQSAAAHIRDNGCLAVEEPVILSDGTHLQGDDLCEAVDAAFTAAEVE